MLGQRSIRVLFLSAITAIFPATVGAQCLDWRAFEESGFETGGSTKALVVHDYNGAPNLFVAGSLFSPTLPHAAVSILRWDGDEFFVLSGGLGGTIECLLSYDDGSGPALYAGGALLTINGVAAGGVARWDGVMWSTFGGGTSTGVKMLRALDDGTGVALYAGGYFTSAGGAPVDRIARWNGTAWSALPNNPVSGTLAALETYDDGTGTALFAGGRFPGGSGGLFKLQAGAWTSVYPSQFFEVTCLQRWVDGAGPALYVGAMGGPPAGWLARYDGTNWTQLSAGVGAPPTSLRLLNLGAGTKLYTLTNSPVTSVRSWDGVSWTALGAALLVPQALTAFDSGSGPQLVLGISAPSYALGSRSTLSSWNGAQWVRVGPTHAGLDGSVSALRTLDLGQGPQLFACGQFTGASESIVPKVARWSGSGWASVTNPYNAGTVTAIGKLDLGTSVQLCLGGGTVMWTVTGGTPNTAITAGFEFDSILSLQEFGGVLYVGGQFTHLNGLATPNLGTWNGNSVGGMGVGMNGAVYALLTFDDGTGNALYAAGTFTTAGGVPANRIARWDGSAWSALGTGLDNLCDTLVAFDDGFGPALYAAGTFLNADGVPAARVAKWQNGSWKALGAGLNAQVLKLTVFDDGSGPHLYAGGNFTAAGTTPIVHIARWSEAGWTAVGAGVDNSVLAMESYDDGSGIGPQLFVGGTFRNVGSQRSDFMAAWRGCGGPISRYCFGDGTVAPCPCGNQGLASRGCDNSAATGGARMNANGSSSPDTIAFYVTGLIPGTAAMLFQGNTAFSAPLALGDGLLCAGGSIRRLEVAFAPAGTLAFPAGASSISAQSAAAGDPLVPGNVRGYQAWYRDSNPSFCTSATSNVSNAVRIVW